MPPNPLYLEFQAIDMEKIIDALKVEPNLKRLCYMLYSALLKIRVTIRAVLSNSEF